MKTMQKFIAAAALVATLGIGAASIANNNAQQPASEKAQAVALLTRKVNEYEGQHRKAQDAALTRKVNEYEGQHRRVMAEQLLTRKVNEYEGQHR